MSNSILTNTKKNLGITDSDTSFDPDIILHINSAFSTLNQLGIGPIEGYSIDSAAPTWDDFIGSDPRLNSVKSYIYLRVRMLFDPPSTSFLIEAFDKQVKEFEWRLNTLRETEILEDNILDGGSVVNVNIDFDGGLPSGSGGIYDGGSPP